MESEKINSFRFKFVKSRYDLMTFSHCNSQRKLQLHTHLNSLKLQLNAYLILRGSFNFIPILVLGGSCDFMPIISRKC